MIFPARQFTIRSLMIVTAYVGVLALFAGELYPSSTAAVIGVWLVPIVVATMIRNRRMLAGSCVTVNLVLFATCFTCQGFSMRRPGWEGIRDAAGVLLWGTSYPAMVVFNQGGYPQSNASLLLVVFAGALLYALVGLGFSYCFPSRLASK